MTVLDTPPPGRPTAVEPSTPASSKRVALARLADVRERIGDFLDQPTTARFRLLMDGAQQFLDVEANQIFPELAAAGLEESCGALQESRQRLRSHLNVLSWEDPGSTGFSAEAQLFRHDLLGHMELYRNLR